MVIMPSLGALIGSFTPEFSSLSRTVDLQRSPGTWSPLWRLEVRRSSEVWSWSVPWKERVQPNDRVQMLVEALRRSIDLRDETAERAPFLTARCLMLVDTLTALLREELSPALLRANKHYGDSEPWDLVAELRSGGFLAEVQPADGAEA